MVRNASVVKERSVFRRLSAAAFVAGLLPPLISSAATYYVNPNMGRDVNDGSLNSPWKTLHQSIPKLSAGDTLIATGTFAESPGYGSGYTLSVSGSAGRPITLRGQNAIINLQDNSGDDGTFHFTGDYIVMDGFKFTSSMRSGVYYGGCFSFDGSHCIAENLEFLKMFGSHDKAAGGADHLWCIVNHGSENTYTNLFFHEVDDADAFRVWGGFNLITACTLSNCLNDFNDANGLRMLHADFVQCWNTGASSCSNVVERCQFINNGISGGMINCADERGNRSAGIHDWTYRNNVFANSKQWIQNYAPGFHFYNNLCYHYGKGSYGQCIYVGPGGTSADIRNNIFIASGVASDSDTTIKDFCAWDAISQSHSSYLAAEYGTSNFVTTATACGFADPARFNFHLTSGSILRGKGSNLYDNPNASKVDFDGKPRPPIGAWDIGPYQYSP